MRDGELLAIAFLIVGPIVCLRFFWAWHQEERAYRQEQDDWRE
jgi:hypothetical protein